MEPISLQPRVNATHLPLDRLAGNARLSEVQKVAEAGRQFEAILLRQILGEGMKPVFKSEFTRQSAQAGIYQDMVVNQLADNLTKAGGIGLAKGLNRDLNRQNTSAPKASGATAHD
ncbi:MAG: rod-binding protein [Verrucomicrobia bacterium]|nr:rod-binding protein [Verrucomicrobiota bacterium]